MSTRMNTHSRVARLLTVPLLVLGLCPSLAAVPLWVEPMRALNAGFDGTDFQVAQLGDSITYSRAFWTPFSHAVVQPQWLPADGLPTHPGPPQAPDGRWRDVILPNSGDSDAALGKGPSAGNFSGWRAADVLAVLDQVILTQRPEVALLMVGSNDVLDFADATDVQGYDADLRAILDRLIAANVIPILNTIPPRVGHLEAVQAVNTVVRDLALEYRVPLADYHAAILERRPGESWLGTLISSDGVHPTGGAVGDLSEANLAISGYALRNQLNLLAYREVYFQVLAPVNAPGSAALLASGAVLLIAGRKRRRNVLNAR